MKRAKNILVASALLLLSLAVLLFGLANRERKTLDTGAIVSPGAEDGGGIILTGLPSP